MVAVRTLQATKEDSDTDFRWQVEWEAMAQGLSHKHLATFMGGWEQLGRRYLMWEWANGGNLERFWSTPDVDSRTTTAIQWAVNQMLGLAEALQTIHLFHPPSRSVHADLRPGTILVFVRPQLQQCPILKIGDIGLGIAEAGNWERNNPYCSPASILNDSYTLSPSDDAWSMECILFEFIIWLLRGPSALVKFRHEEHQREKRDDVLVDRFYQVTTGNGIEPSDAVIRWMESMQQNDLDPPGKLGPSPALQNLLSYLVTQLIEHFSESKTEAPSVGVSRLCGELRLMRSRGSEDPAYFFNTDEAKPSKTKLGSKQLQQETVPPHVPQHIEVCS
jgi:hypothetical protein